MSKNKAAIIVVIIFILQSFLHVYSNQKTDFPKAKEYYHQGEKLLEQFKLDEARAHFKKAIEEDMNFTQAHRSYIDVSLQMGEEFRDELQKEYEAYLATQPNNPVIYYALGRIYEDIDDREKVFQKAIELDPNEELFYSSLARLLYERDPNRYKQVQEIILKKFPDNYSAAMIVYQRASGIKDEAEKAAALEVYLKSFPDGPNASIALRRVLDFYKNNNPGKAEKIARDTLSRSMIGTDKRSHRNAYLFLFQKAVDSKDMNEVEKICSEILASKNTDPSLYAQVAYQLKEVKNFDLAEKSYLKAIEMITPENVYGTIAHGSFSEESLVELCKQVANWYRASLGKLYLEINRPKKALAQFNQVELKDPDSEHYLLLAKAYDQIGNKEKAYESLIESLSLGANKEASEEKDRKETSAKEKSCEEATTKKACSKACTKDAETST